MDIYRVGGAVRDRLLGLSSQDTDWVVVGSTPQELLALGFQPVGQSFPVFLHPTTKEEYALARTEKKTGPGYKGFICDFEPTVTLEEDLSRRDLTINAIAEAASGLLIDPYGGQQDIQNKILRHVSPAFVEDPVRVLRVARFMARYACLGFQIAPETMQLMQEIVSAKELESLKTERIWMEFQKALSEPTPAAFIQTLRACGALLVVLPEVDRLYGVPQPPEHHPEVDTGLHIELVLSQAARLSADPKVRFAALLHDVGKGVTPPQYWPKHHGHEEKGRPIVQKICERLQVPRDYASLALAVAENHGLIYRLSDLKAEMVLKILHRLDIFRSPEILTSFLFACEADHRGRPGFEEKSYPQAALFRQYAAACLAVSPLSIIQPEMSGLEIQEALFKARVSAIEKVKL